MAIERIVSDTSPLINVTGIALLDVLPELYGNVWIPTEVVREFAAKARPSDPDLSRLPWITVVSSVPADPSLPSLGPGETAALSVARREGIRFVLLDEKKARRIAASVGLLPIGTLAVLLGRKSEAWCRRLDRSSHSCRFRAGV